MGDWEIAFGAALNPPILNNRTILHGRPSTKIVSFDVHPTHNLIVTAHEDQSIKLWSYDTKTLSSVGSCLQKEFDFNPSTSPYISTSADDTLMSGTTTIRSTKKSANIRCVKFYDNDVLIVKAMNEMKRPIEKLKIEKVEQYNPIDYSKWNSRVIDGSSWIIVATDSATLFFNYWTQQFEEIPQVQLDNKTVVSINFFLEEPIIALGCSDGNIRLWNLVNWEKVGTLYGGHAKAIVGIYVYGKGKDLRAITAGEEGKICYWKWNPDKIGDKKKITKDQVSKAHDRIESATYNFVTHTFVTSGQDRSIAIWNIAERSEEYRVKPPIKVVWSSALPFLHPKFLNDTTIICSKDNPKLYVTGVGGQGLREILDITDLTGTTKKTRPHIITLHPRRPDLIFLSTRSDIYVIFMEPNCGPDFTLVPAIKGEVESGKTIRKVMKEHILYMNDADKIFALTLDGKKREKVITLSRKGGKAELLFSPGNRFLAVFWANKHRYQIYNAESMKNISSGKAKSFAWFNDHQFQLLPEDEHERFVADSKLKFEIFITVEVILPTSDGKKKKKKKGENPSPEAQSKLYKHTITKNGKIEKIEINVGSDMEGVTVFSGNTILVGISPKLTISNNEGTSGGGGGGGSSGSSGKVGRKINSGVDISGRDGEGSSITSTVENTFTRKPTFCRFLDVLSENTLLGPKLPVPLLVFWDPCGDYCVMAFETTFSIFATKPTFRMLCNLPFVITSGLWFNGTFIFVSADQIAMLMPMGRISSVVTIARFSDSLNNNMNTILSKEGKKHNISSFLHGNNEVHKNDNVFIDDYDYEYEQERPIGALSLVKVDGEDIILLDTCYNIYRISLRSPFHKFYIMSGANHISEAVQWAEYIPHIYHSKLAKLLIDIGQSAQALQLSGLTAHVKLDICITAGLLYEGVDCLRDLVALAKKYNKKERACTDGSGSSSSSSSSSSFSSSSSSSSTTGRILFNKKQFKQQTTKLIELAEQSGKSDQMEEVLRIAVSIEPQLYRNLILSYVANGKRDKVLDLLEELQKEDDLSELALFAALFTNSEESLMKTLKLTNSHNDICLNSTTNLSYDTLSNWSFDLRESIEFMMPLTMINPLDNSEKVRPE